jgi:hypothetical protein
MALIPPQPVGVVPGSGFWNDWIEKIRFVVNNLSQGQIDHQSLLNLQGGNTSERYHLTSTQQSGLISTGDTSLHYHSTDRARSNHTGTQLMATISDLPVLISNNYTPTATSIANCTISSVDNAQYTRIGSIGSVSGRVNIAVTAGATATAVAISLPISSNIGNINQINGTASSQAINQTGAIYGDAANDRAQIEFISTSTGAVSLWFHFMYQII